MSTPSMSAQAASGPHPSAASDLVRLAIPIVLIAAAVAGAMWIDRGAPAPADETTAATSGASD